MARRRRDNQAPDVVQYQLIHGNFHDDNEAEEGRGSGGDDDHEDMWWQDDPEHKKKKRKSRFKRDRVDKPRPNLLSQFYDPEQASWKVLLSNSYTTSSWSSDSKAHEKKKKNKKQMVYSCRRDANCHFQSNTRAEVIQHEKTHDDQGDVRALHSVLEE